ncbi:hypothetical protein PLESTB_001480400 [Pleodorina starrii]|uniref:Uncharacterized protein n=1 Tax=Pleodorina starrii TaxID=330485 RepID=A0A9W6F7P1_9CHLO|nr:hypothetical protein PLESTM_000651900 [Pleodorina starrii]GLC59383.1 hypothetical protein PLESTB_001480400 [Pleodorina starrii]GLC74418.1 hypothetical protein PLESTF_001510900 [Pleodorina starrii]
MNPDPSKILGALNDIGVKVTLGIAGTVAAGAAIVVPNGKQVESASLEMFGREPSQLLPNERRAAEFCAGYRRWKGFVNNNIYSWTRTLPGHDNPIVNPYKGPRRIPRPQPKVEEELEAAAAKE